MGVEPYANSEEEERARRGGAQRLLDDWHNKYCGPDGFSGSIRIQAQSFDGAGRSRVSPVFEKGVGDSVMAARIDALPVMSPARQTVPRETVPPLPRSWFSRLFDRFFGKDRT